ncbi:hypothetical protein SBY92_001528 [Candida maltosa Xu316]
MHQPLPLIQSHDQENHSINHDKLKLYGYFLLISTWIVFIISINTFFEIWRFIIQAIPSPLRETLTGYFEILDSYILKIWCIYIVCWWWAVISWCGLEMFRNSKK